MNDKVNFLNFFFDSGKYAEESSLTRKVIDLFPGMICIYDAGNDRLTYANQKFRDYFGPHAENLFQSEDPFSQIVFSGDTDRLRNEFEKFRFVPERGSHSFDCRFWHPSDNFHYFRTSGTVLKKGNEGNAPTILFVSENVTDQMKTQQEEEARTQLFDETEEALNFGTWSWDVETGKVVWTKGMFKLLGYEAEQFPQGVTNEFYFDHVLAEYVDELNAVVQTALKKQQPFDIEYALRTKGGDVKIVRTKGKVFVGEDGQVKKLFGITHDITALRNFENEQARHLRDLNRSNKELEEFAYVASHDLQEPLRKIAMFSERLRAKVGDSLEKDAQLFLDRILASADNMRILIDNLLEFSRANRSSKVFAQTDLNKVLRDVKTNLELKIEETNTRITIDPLPTIQAVGSEMEQVFRNLLSNAIKFRRKDTAPQIQILSRKATREEKAKHGFKSDVTYHIIQVKDNGIGFEEEYAEKIFQIFQRLHGKTEYPGSGIGLSICKKIIENHHGVITASSVAGEGSTFTIVIPEKQP